MDSTVNPAHDGMPDRPYGSGYPREKSMRNRLTMVLVPLLAGPATERLGTIQTAPGNVARAAAAQALRRNCKIPSRWANSVLASCCCGSGRRGNVGIAFFRQKGPRQCLGGERPSDCGSDLARVDSRGAGGGGPRQLSRGGTFGLLGWHCSTRRPRCLAERSDENSPGIFALSGRARRR